MKLAILLKTVPKSAMNDKLPEMYASFTNIQEQKTF